MKSFLLSIGIVVMCVCSFVNISAQNNIDSLPEDPLNAIWKFKPQIINHNLAFLLQEDSCYNFHIVEIISLPSGYIIIAHTKVDNFNVLAYIVTSKKCSDIKIAQKKIKTGENYKLHLRRYFLIPAHVSIENIAVVDIMFGNKTMSINENGEYTYLFTSFDIEGLYLIKNREVAVRKQKFQEEEVNIKNGILPFLEYISYGKQFANLFNVVDTVQIRRSLNRYGRYNCGRGPGDFNFPEKKYEWYIDHPVKKYDWQYWDRVNPKKYEEIFWKMLKNGYSLPIDSQGMNRDFLYSSIKLKLLHYSEKEIYTVQIIWKLPNVKKTFVAIISIQKKKKTYKVIGFNKSYGGYRLHLKEKNEIFVPE